MKIRVVFYFMIFLPGILFCQSDETSAKEPEKDVDYWDAWAFDAGIDYRIRNEDDLVRETENDYEISFRIFASKKMKNSSLNIWTSFDHYDAVKYSDVERAGTFRNEILYLFPVSKRLSFVGNTIFETQNRDVDSYGILEWRTFGALKPGVEYDFLPRVSQSKSKIKGIYTLGPHYLYRGKNLDFTAFQSLELDAYYKLYFFSFSFRAAAYQNLENLEEFNFYLNPNISTTFFSVFSINIGAHSYYYDWTNNDLAYFLRVRDIEVNLFEFNDSERGMITTPYIGVNYHFGSKRNDYYNIRF